MKSIQQIGTCLHCGRTWGLASPIAEPRCSDCGGPLDLVLHAVRSKYHAVITEVEGVKFQSRAEAQRWQELRLLEKSGHIHQLRRQVRFSLSVNGGLITTYVADFVYEDEQGYEIVEDVKSVHTRKLETYRIKRKLMKQIYGIEITEVVR